MYEIHFRRSAVSKRDFSLIASGINTLEEARNKRSVSGDLVVYASNHEVVKSYDWLFDWEKLNPNCYAQQAIGVVDPCIPVYDAFGYLVGMI